MNASRPRQGRVPARAAGKGETPAEIAGFARALLGRAVDPQIDPARLPGPAIDVCGTGGDRLHLFNVSTTVAFVLAAGGACVVKHGNRAITSKSGGADVLAALGVPLDLPPEGLRRSLETTGFGFLFAPQYHPAFKAITPVRRLLAAEGGQHDLQSPRAVAQPGAARASTRRSLPGRDARDVCRGVAATRTPERVDGSRRGRHG